MRAELIQQSGNLYRPYNVFVDGVCIGEFIPNDSTSVDRLADALGIPKAPPHASVADEIEAGMKEFEQNGYSHEDGFRAYKFWARELLAEVRRGEK